MRRAIYIGKLFFCLLFIHSHSVAQEQQFNFPKVPLIYNLNPEDYSGGVQNWDMAQDKRGLLYVANNSGLLEFDGTNWQTHRVQTGSRVLSLFVDKDSIIYIGGQNLLGYMAADSIGGLVYHSLIDLIPEEEQYLENVWKVFRQDNFIVFNTSRYTYFFDGKEMTSVLLPSGGRNIFQAGSQLLAYIENKGLLIWNGVEFRLVQNGSKTLYKGVIDILPFYRGGYLLFLSNGQIKLYNQGKFSDWVSEMSDFLKKSLINTAVVLSDNNIAIGTQNNGLVVLKPNGKLVLHLSKKKGLNSNTVNNIYMDQFQNLWLGLSNGISFIDYGSPFSIIDERLGLPGTGYSAYLKDESLYLGTNNGLFLSFSSNKAASVEDDSYRLVPNSEGQVYSVGSYKDKLLIGHHQGAFTIEKNVAKKIKYNGVGLWSYTVLPNNHEIIGGTYEGFVKLNENRLTHIEGFKESSRVFQFENDSTLWVSHGFKGVFKVQFDAEFTKITKTVFYGKEKGFPSDLLINVFKINDKLVFPAERGIFTYNRDTDNFEPYPKLETPLGTQEYISSLAANPLGDIYYIKQNKFGRLKRDNFGEYIAQEEIFNNINKYLLDDDLENINVLDHKNILIGAKEGFIHYDPTVEKLKVDIFNTYLRSIEITKDSIQQVYAGSLTKNSLFSTFDSDLKSIKFRFSSPYLDGFHELQYQYKLEGFDEEWSPWKLENDKEYTNLNYGDYTFQARAKNIYGDISEPATYSFNVTRPWYLTRLAIGLYFIAVLILFGFAMLLLDSKHRIDKKKMAISQERAIHKKDLQIESVSKVSEQKITELRNEKLKADVEFKNKELAASTMHLLNKNEVMLDIKSKLQALTTDESPKPAEIKKIVKSIDRNISEDKDWDQFTIHFDHVHGDFLKKLKSKYSELTPQETKLAAYLRMNLTSKDVAQLLNISVRGVEISRYRLRKKLTLERETNLVTFLMDI